MVSITYFILILPELTTLLLSYGLIGIFWNFWSSWWSFYVSVWNIDSKVFLGSSETVCKWLLWPTHQSTLLVLSNSCLNFSYFDIVSTVSSTFIWITDCRRPVRKSPLMHGQKSTPTPKFIGMAEACFVCNIGQNFQISLIYWMFVVLDLNANCVNFKYWTIYSPYN